MPSSPRSAGASAAARRREAAGSASRSLAIVAAPCALTAIKMQQPALARASPIAAGVVVVIAGALQFTAWKAHHLACCREAPGRGITLSADTATALRHGLSLGLHCNLCCANLITVLLVIGMMDFRAMIVVAAAIMVERLAPAAERVAQFTGAAVIAAGAFMMLRTAGMA